MGLPYGPWERRASGRSTFMTMGDGVRARRAVSTEYTREGKSGISKQWAGVSASAEARAEFGAWVEWKEKGKAQTLVISVSMGLASWNR